MLAKLLSINISKGGIPKLPVPQVQVEFSGLLGDGHNHAKHNSPIQAVCLQDMEQIEQFKQMGYALNPGTAGENLTVTSLNVNALPIGSKLFFSGGVVLEISKVRKPCYVMDQINPQLKCDVQGRHGMYAKVVSQGHLQAGESISVVLPQ